MSRRYTFHVTAEDGARRLDDFLASRLGGLSRMRIGNLLARGACLVDGSPGPPGHRLSPGETVEITVEGDAPTSMRPERVSLEIIYEDGDMLVVVKPAGMLVHPTRGVKSGTLANALTYHLNREFYARGAGHLAPPGEEDGRDVAAPAAERDEARDLVRPGLVHRLDRDTSGLMAVAKTPRALTVLSRHFHRRLVEKRYVAVVRGRVAGPDGAVRAPIGRDPERRPQWGVAESGKPAETRFRVLESARDATLIELEPVTGRTNQLRIHCAHIGHPILGDRLYGDGERPDLTPRLCLHAWKLCLHHPRGGQWMEFASPLPPDIALLFQSLK